MAIENMLTSSTDVLKVSLMVLNDIMSLPYWLGAFFCQTTSASFRKSSILFSTASVSSSGSDSGLFLMTLKAKIRGKAPLSLFKALTKALTGLFSSRACMKCTSPAMELCIISRGVVSFLQYSKIPRRKRSKRWDGKTENE